MSAATGHRNPHNVGLSAGQAPLSCPVVYPVVHLEPAAFTIDADVLRVGQSAAACLNRFPKHAHDRGMQLGYLAGRNRVGCSIPAHSSEMKALVAIDVANASDHMLIKQQRFDLARAASENIGELFASEPIGDRIDTHLRHFRQFDRHVPGIEDNHFTERAWINEPQLLCRLTREVHDDVGVWWSLGSGWRDEQTTAHAQVHHQLVAGIQRAEQVLTAAINGSNGCSGEPVDNAARGRATNRSFATDFDLGDAATDDLRDEPTPHCFNFWQLRHCYPALASAADSDSATHACSAAACSANFFERPSPAPTDLPETMTVAEKLF